MPLVGTSKKKWSTKVSLYINIFIFVLADRMMTNCNIYPGKKTWPQFPDECDCEISISISAAREL